ncbi:nucleotidyltransferase substrate binding protein [candidate division WOR-3 bacterium]|nr:nucleotidyltransferase substrate binding protein [candidate division WOR-3 bacterium]
MERLEMRGRDTQRALSTLKEILDEPFSLIVRDATIQRFEYTFESLWKFLKAYLKEKEGILSDSPKGCFRRAFSLDFLTEEEIMKFLEMTDDRNMTSHTYKEEIAQMLYPRIGKYAGLMGKLLDRLSNRITQDPEII